MNRGKHVRSAVVYVVLILLLVWSFTAFRSAQQENFISYSQVRSYFLNEQVTAFQVEDNQTLVLQMEDGKVWYHRLADVELFYNDLGDVIDQQQADGTLKEFDIQPAYEMPLWLQITIPIVGTVVVVMVIWGVMAMRQQNAQGGQGGMSRFGKARTVQGDGTVKVTFADVAGADEEKAELQELVDFLRNPQKYIDLGARIPKGVLLVGPPGTGKTLLAKAVAGEAGVKFLSISGSDFVELYVGVGASRVRDLFDQAKKEAPAIVFIDEIDAVGRQRGAGLGGGHDEREQTLNQLLVEMDGFAANEGVIVLAATNRQDILDPALLRPGRFDRRIPVELPDQKGREDILKVHARKVAMEPNIDFGAIARVAAGASGAELANIINEAALRAVRSGRDKVSQSDLEESVEVVIAGYQKKNAILSDKEKMIVAYHEIGHAMVAALQSHSAPVTKITIIPRTSGALGYTMQVDQGNHYLMSKEEIENKIATLTGGRVAEELIFQSVTTGASNDIEQATRLARAMITRYGMSEEFGMVALETVQNQYLGGDTSLACSAETAALVDHRVVKLVKTQYEKAKELLSQNLPKLHSLAKYLYDNETITGQEFMRLLEQEPAKLPSAESEDRPGQPRPL